MIWGTAVYNCIHQSYFETDFTFGSSFKVFIPQLSVVITDLFQRLQDRCKIYSSSMMNGAPCVREDPSTLFSDMEAFGNQTHLNEEELFLRQDSSFDFSLIELKPGSEAVAAAHTFFIKDKSWKAAQQWWHIFLLNTTCIFHNRNILPPGNFANNQTRRIHVVIQYRFSDNSHVSQIVRVWCGYCFLWLVLVQSLAVFHSRSVRRHLFLRWHFQQHTCQLLPLLLSYFE